MNSNEEKIQRAKFLLQKLSEQSQNADVNSSNKDEEYETSLQGFIDTQQKLKILMELTKKIKAQSNNQEEIKKEPKKKKGTKKVKFIDNEEEHNKVLFELGILDDEEDWTLYQEQEKHADEENSIDDDTYTKYVSPVEPIYSELLPESITALLDEHFQAIYKHSKLKVFPLDDHLSFFKRELHAFDIHIANDRPYLYEDIYQDLQAYQSLVKVIFQLENMLKPIELKDGCIVGTLRISKEVLDSWNSFSDD